MVGIMNIIIKFMKYQIKKFETGLPRRVTNHPAISDLTSYKSLLSSAIVHRNEAVEYGQAFE